jgi:hypothetical protein
MFTSAGFAENWFRGCITSPERRSDHHQHNFRGKKTKKPHQGDTLRRRFEATKAPNPASFVGRQIATACTGYSCSLI